MAELRLDLPDGVDRALRHAQAHAGLQQDEGGADAADEGPRRIGDQRVGADEGSCSRTAQVLVPSIAENDGQLLQLDRRRVAAQPGT